MKNRRSRSLVPGIISALALTATTVMTVPALADDHENVAGEPTITIPINDSAAGGTYNQNFTRAYAGETPEGTPVYIYVPEGTPLDGSAPSGVDSLDPQFDHNPGDDFVPCPTATADSFKLGQDQINYVGDMLANRIVAVNEAHYGPMDAANPDDPASDSLVMLVYNVQDDNYYDCAVTTYTAGYFAPGYITSIGMNVMVVDGLDWANRVGPDDSPWRDDDPSNDRAELYEGVVGHELEHLLHNYSDAGELSWVDEGLADMAIFLNDFDAGGSHLSNHQVFYEETSLTRWGGSLANYGAAFTYFLYLWEQAGGNGDGTFEPDLEYDGVAGDLLIKTIFEEQADGMDGVQNAVDTFNAATGANLRSAAELFKDWSVAVYLDDEGSDVFDVKAFNFGDPADTSWTMDIADDVFWAGRGSYQGATPEAKWSRLKNRPDTTAVPFGMSVERFRNPGPTVNVAFDGDPMTQVAPHAGDTHRYGGYVSQSENLLEVEAGAAPASADFWTWYFIEEGWDFGFMEALVGGEWITVPLVDDEGNVVTTNDDPHGNNTEGNGLTGTSGGEYFVDDPTYIHLSADLPAGATDVRFRYSTDAAYLDTGWFVDDVQVNGAPAAVTSPDGSWLETTGVQENNWTAQVVASCDLTPGTDSAGEIVDNLGNHVYRFEGDSFDQNGLETKCANGNNDDFALLISNLPSGDLTYLDADYTFRVRNVGH